MSNGMWKTNWLRLMLVASCCVLALAGRGFCDDASLEQIASWQMIDDAEALKSLETALKDQGSDDQEIEKAGLAFTEGLKAGDRLEAFVLAAGSVLPKLVEKLEQIDTAPNSPGEDPFIAFSTTLRAHARLFVGRSMVRQRLFDEALPLLDPIEPIEVSTPELLLFYRGVCNHALLNKKEAIEDLNLLIENKDLLPRRFSRTAEMMLADIEPVKEGSLDEIARLMNDVSRRLDLGRSDSPVVEKEQEIIDKLNKLIEQEEEKQKQRQQQMQQQQSGGQNSQSKPMEDSQIGGGSGPGEVDRKDLEQRKWGDLPPAQRQEALQKISQDLPTHYRDAIDAYFRKLATEKRQ